MCSSDLPSLPWPVPMAAVALIAEAEGCEIIPWNVKSTTRAQDGLYVYDTVQRLYDSRFGDKDVNDISHYIKLGPMGKAFDSDKRVVLLIDEVDRADTRDVFAQADWQLSVERVVKVEP